MALFLKLFANTSGSLGRVGLRSTMEIVHRNLTADNRVILIKLQEDCKNSLIVGSGWGLILSIAITGVCIPFENIPEHAVFGVGIALTIRHAIIQYKIRNLAQLTYEKEYKKSGKTSDLLIELTEEVKNEKKDSRLI